MLICGQAFFASNSPQDCYSLLRHLNFLQTNEKYRRKSYCLWATKKIFLLFLRMNSNSRKNEILADARAKSANADEIFGFASDEIKSTHSPSRRISPNEVGFHRSRRFHPPARVDLVEKSTDKVDAFFCLWATKKMFLPFLRMNSNPYNSCIKISVCNKLR